MSDMSSIVWIFPIIFMIHELEEMLCINVWLCKNKGIVCRYSLLKKFEEDYSHVGFVISVIEEYIIIVAIVIFSLISDTYLIWTGSIIAFSIHLAFHIAQAVFIRKYVPALVTSLILMPVSFIVIWKSLSILKYSVGQVVTASIFMCLVMVGNLVVLHYVMGKIKKRKMERY